ncbi:lytic transglycosylase domain-containing protein [Paraburkholderia adhaesiva]|uniref:lytic transglycosylase domain-containing protein n=1 Tax=Paraburkholderia adhaesiva TaxID=2883244 RepID=UPI001F31AC2A|nr:lytic transglycosylase domain-containing protein [Paraburkholderia adhaesiva]
MAGKTFTYTISAVDKATATIERVNKQIDRMTAPFRRAAQSAKALSDASGLTKVANNLGNVAKQADKAARSITKMAAPLLAIVGGGTLAGLSEMVAHWERIGAETERTSRMLGITANQLTQMRSAATLMGVSADTVTSGFQSLQDTLQDARWGRNQGAFATLQALGIRLRTTRSGAIDTQAAMYDLADRMQRIQKRDPAAARNLARSLGVEQLLPVLVQGRAAMQRYEAEARRLRGDFTPDMANRAQAFSQALSGMGLAVDGLKVSIADKLAPVLGPMIEKFSNWIAINRDLISQRVAALVERIAKALERLFEGVDWDSFLDDIGDTVDSISRLVTWLLNAVKAMGGFKSVAIGVALYMAGGFVTSIFSAVGSIAGLVGRLGGLAAALTSAGTAATTAAEAVTGAEAATAGAGAAGAGAAGAGAAAEGAAGAGAAAAAGGGLLARMLGGVMRFVNPLTVGAYLGLHSEELGGQSEADTLKRIRAAEAASGGQWTGANFQPTDAMKNATVTQWAKSLNFAGLEKQYGLTPGLLSAVAQVESGGNASAVSRAGAAGLFQFMPATAREYGINPLDPTQAAGAAAKKLAGLMQHYHGNLSAALAAYNWGEGNVDRRGLANAPAETQAYAPKVLAALRAYGDAPGDEDTDANAAAPMPSLNAPSPQQATTAAPVVNVNTQVHVERDGRTSVRTQTPTGLSVAYPMAPQT